MKKILVKIVEKVQKIQIPFFRKTVSIITTVVTVVEIKESIGVIINASQPTSHRTRTAARKTCCSCAKISSQ